MHCEFSEPGGSKEVNTSRKEYFIDIAKPAPLQRVGKHEQMVFSNIRKRVDAEVSEEDICGDTDASPTPINLRVTKDPCTSPVGAMAAVNTAKCLELASKALQVRDQVSSGSAFQLRRI